jgi:hypothetical protein
MDCEPVTQAKMRFFARRIQILKKTSQNLVTIHKNPLSPGPHADTRGKAAAALAAMLKPSNSQHKTGAGL